MFGTMTIDEARAAFQSTTTALRDNSNIHVVMGTGGEILPSGHLSAALLSDNNQLTTTSTTTTIASKNNNLTFGEFTGGHNVTGDKRTWLLLGYPSVSANNNAILVNNTSGPIFYANITLLRLDGSMPIIHQIKDFKLLQASTESNGLSTVFKGTSTVNTTTSGQVANVPTTIVVALPEKGDNSHQTVVTIFLDPSKVNYEFGKTPLYSLVRNYDTSVPLNLLNVPIC
jgi:hypothetical protein